MTTRIVTIHGHEWYVTRTAVGKYDIAGAGQALPANTVFGRTNIDRAWEQGTPVRIPAPGPRPANPERTS